MVSRDRVAQGRKDSAPRAGEKQREAAKMQQAKQAKSRQRDSGRFVSGRAFGTFGARAAVFGRDSAEDRQLQSGIAAEVP